MRSVLLSPVKRLLLIVSVIVPISLASESYADGIDHKVNKETSGIWNPDVYRGMLLGLTVGQVGLALWEGGNRGWAIRPGAASIRKSSRECRQRR